MLTCASQFVVRSYSRRCGTWVFSDAVRPSRPHRRSYPGPRPDLVRVLHQRNTLPHAARFPGQLAVGAFHPRTEDRKSTRLNSSHVEISYAVFCLKKKKKMIV